MSDHLLISFFILVLCIDAARAGLFEKNRVVIVNELQHGKLLMVHCKSKDDDLKFHLLAPGAIYEFGFRDNAPLTTPFWCNLWQGPRYKHHQAFEVYRSLGVPQFGRRFAWESREDGIYQYIDESRSVFRYRWDAPHGDDSPSSSFDENLPPR
ncbi:PREDICTED: pumilio homolog 15 [Tarenaya hassleriana]|uniref:pumilio homolog 15 n=1 Tax=Tarenaya hassleriana TaxID=28532 RepID=UPI00053C65D5|nr:PREDICTED: pumilio homolog 15 [Tarenaya hassleriana]